MVAVSPGLPEGDVARVRKWCDQRVPEDVRDEIRVECDVAARHLTVMECRPPWKPEYDTEWIRSPIARLRYIKARREWTLYWSDRHSAFHRYDRIPPSTQVDDLLTELERDPTCIFWG